METRLTAWIDRNLNGYTAGLGTAFGLVVGGYIAFGCSTSISSPAS